MATPAGTGKVSEHQQHDSYKVERLVLDLNGIVPVPALLLIPGNRQTPAPGLIPIHGHAGMCNLGKEQLLHGVKVQPAPVYAQKGLVTRRSIAGVLVNVNMTPTGK